MLIVFKREKNIKGKIKLELKIKLLQINHLLIILGYNLFKTTQRKMIFIKFQVKLN